MNCSKLLFFTLLLSAAVGAFARQTKPVHDTISSKNFLDYYNHPDTGLNKSINDMLKEEARLKKGGSKSVPLPVEFRQGFIELIPTIKSRFRSIGSRQTSGDLEDGVTLIPSEAKPLPGTTSNYYESLVDGLTLTYNVTLRAGIDSNLSAARAAVLTDQWKTMLQAAFPESSSLFADKTDNRGNRFVTVAYLTNPASPTYSGGYTITIQNLISKENHNIGLVIVEKAEK